MKAIRARGASGTPLLKRETIVSTLRSRAGQSLVAHGCAVGLALGAAVLAAAQSLPPVDTSGWKTLREAALGFQLKHPAAWNVGRSTGTLEGVVLREPARAGTPGAVIQVFVQRGINPQGMSIERWYADQLTRLRVTTPPPTSATVLGGRPAIRREMSLADGQQYDYYTAINASDVFQVSIKQPMAQPQVDRIYEAVLSTITFVR